jgi:hypothetical protein
MSRFYIDTQRYLGNKFLGLRSRQLFLDLKLRFTKPLASLRTAGSCALYFLFLRSALQSKFLARAK